MIVDVPIRRHVGRNHPRLILAALHDPGQALQRVLLSFQFLSRRAHVGPGIFFHEQILVPNQQLKRRVAAGGDALQRLEGVDVLHRVVHRLLQPLLELSPGPRIVLAPQPIGLFLVDLAVGQPVVDVVQLVQRLGLFLVEQILVHVRVQVLARPLHLFFGQPLLVVLHLLDPLGPLLLVRQSHQGRTLLLLPGLGSLGNVNLRPLRFSRPPALGTTLDLGLGLQPFAADDPLDRPLHAGRHPF